MIPEHLDDQSLTNYLLAKSGPMVLIPTLDSNFDIDISMARGTQENSSSENTPSQRILLRKHSESAFNTPVDDILINLSQSKV